MPFRRPTKKVAEAALRKRREKEVPKEFQVDGCFERIRKPDYGDWLSDQPETGQRFQSFLSLSMRCTPHSYVDIIELVVIGPWDPNRAPNLDNIVRYTAAFFSGCQVRVAKERVKLKSKVLAENSREGGEGQLQICVGSITDYLNKRKLDKEVVCQVAVTMVDIYPIKDGIAWNFVFGQAIPMDCVGVFSFSRYADGFPVEWNDDLDIKAGDYDKVNSEGKPLEAEARKLLFKRSCKVLAHEIGHIFGIKHCIYYQCLMNGSNHMTESDGKPIYYCPIDLRKLQEALKFDVLERHKKLLALWTEFGWGDEAAWGEKRLMSLKKSTKESPKGPADVMNPRAIKEEKAAHDDRNTTDVRQPQAIKQYPIQKKSPILKKSSIQKKSPIKRKSPMPLSKKRQSTQRKFENPLSIKPLAIHRRE